MRAQSGSLIALLAAAAATLVACGTATTVTPAAPTPVIPVLAPGAYTLSIAPDTTANGQFSTWMCLTIGSAPTSAAVVITLGAADGGYAGRAVNGSLSLSFTVSGAAVTGVVRGSAGGSDGVTVTFGEAGQNVSITGTATSDATLRGAVNGKVVIGGASGSASCSAWAWTLSRQ